MTLIMFADSPTFVDRPRLSVGVLFLALLLIKQGNFNQVYIAKLLMLSTLLH
jgi:hypothetical protein